MLDPPSHARVDTKVDTQVKRGQVAALCRSLYVSDILVPTAAPDEALMALTNLTKRWFAHCAAENVVSDPDRY